MKEYSTIYYKNTPNIRYYYILIDGLNSYYSLDFYKRKEHYGITYFDTYLKSNNILEDIQRSNYRIMRKVFIPEMVKNALFSRELTYQQTTYTKRHKEDIILITFLLGLKEGNKNN